LKTGHPGRGAVLFAAFLAAAIIGGCTVLPPETPPASPTVTRTPTTTLTPTVTLTPTPEPLVPTPLPSATATVAPTTTIAARAEAVRDPVTTPSTTALPLMTPTQRPTSTSEPATAAAPTPPPSAAALPWSPAPARARDRLGVGVPLGQITDYDWGDGLPGWYLNWRTELNPQRPAGIRFAQMVHIFEDEYLPPLARIQAIAADNPGSLWLIGNEPDVAWQDNTTPEQYAETYGILYPAIKQADPTAQVAIGGVSQPTPLRLDYLDRVLAAYQNQYGNPMPVDIWNVHAFILREEADSWGVGIPPGMDATQGTLYEIPDHTDMAIFQKQLVDFRRWMAAHGFRDKPLVVSEYGVLMPDTYGFPPDVVSQFMLDTFDFMLTARDPEIGYALDDNRLVQAFCWYSTADTRYPTPNLFDPETRAVTPLGEVFQAYAAGIA